MKRITPSEIIRTERMRAKRFVSELEQRRRHPERLLRLYQARSERETRKDVHVSAPAHMNLEADASPTLAFIREVRQEALLKRDQVFFDLRPTQTISLEAALVLAAEAQRLRIRTPGFINGVHSASPVVNELMGHLKFFDFLRISKPLPRLSGVIAAPPPEKIYVSLQSGAMRAGGHISGEVSTAIVPNGMLRASAHRGLNEALINSISHAYPDEDRDEYLGLKHWWICGYRDNVNQEAGFLSLDLGVGIPRTLTRNNSETIEDMLLGVASFVTPSKLTNDHHIIRAAMELGRSRHAVAGRGKGFQDFKTLIDKCEDGQLKVVSRRGECQYLGRGRPEVAVPFMADLEGTLVVWRVKRSPDLIWD